MHTNEQAFGLGQRQSLAARASWRPLSLTYLQMFLRVLVYFTLQVILTIGHLESEGPYFLSRTSARHRIGFRFLNLLFTKDGNKFLWNTCNFPGVDKTCSRRSEDNLGREVSP